MVNVIDLMRTIDPAAVFALETYNQKGDWRKHLTSKIHSIFTGDPTNQPLRLLVGYYEGHKHELGGYNNWLEPKAKKYGEIEDEPEWEDLTVDQKIQYGLFLELTNRLHFVGPLR